MFLHAITWPVYQNKDCYKKGFAGNVTLSRTVFDSGLVHASAAAAAAAAAADRKIKSGSYERQNVSGLIEAKRKKEK